MESKDKILKAAVSSTVALLLTFIAVTFNIWFIDDTINAGTGFMLIIYFCIVAIELPFAVVSIIIACTFSNRLANDKKLGNITCIAGITIPILITFIILLYTLIKSHNDEVLRLLCMIFNVPFILGLLIVSIIAFIKLIIKITK